MSWLGLTLEEQAREKVWQIRISSEKRNTLK